MRALLLAGKLKQINTHDINTVVDFEKRKCIDSLIHGKKLFTIFRNISEMKIMVKHGKGSCRRDVLSEQHRCRWHSQVLKMARKLFSYSIKCFSCLSSKLNLRTTHLFPMY